ncbi:MAG TPA: phosphoribosyltransferase family protein [Parachlamydiaceae bacterium]|nr:phosphoribosyltransferase family protein [Parachlamydiaceae bacterium]
MYFKDRRDAGRLLGQLLAQYRDDDVVVYALPRGGVVVAEEIANFLDAPIDLILAHKIGHPYQPEYAVAAVSESGHIIGNPKELIPLGKAWLDGEKEQQINEIKRKRLLYLKGKNEIPLQGKIAIIVDDGIATGLTMQAGIRELKDRRPEKIVIAVPVTPKETANLLKNTVDDLVSIIAPDSTKFLGSIGAYYDTFDQVEDSEVISILDRHYKKDKQ